MGFRHIDAGVCIGSRHLSFALLERRGGSFRLKEGRVVDLPAGLISPSPAKPNVTDPKAFRSLLEEVLGHFIGIKFVSVGLSDPSVRATVLSLNSQPQKSGDLENLIRWQMEKVFLAPLGDARLAYQPLGSTPNRYFAVTVQDHILQEFENPLKALGIQPIYVNTASLEMFNLYHDLLLQQAGAAGRFIVLNLFDDSLTLMIFMEGLIDFIRIKGFKPGADDRMPDLDDHALSDLIMGELNTSLGFYSQDQDPSLVTHMFVFGRKVSEFIKRAHDQYHIEVEPLEPERLTFLEGLAKVRPEELPLLTPAIAAAVGGRYQFSLASASYRGARTPGS